MRTSVGEPSTWYRSKHDHLPNRLAFVQEVEAMVDVVELEFAGQQAIDGSSLLKSST
jgi:hypothetical protein